MKQSINKDHPRIQNRTPEHQEYRDALSDTLNLKRVAGETGKELASNLLERVENSFDYIVGKYGYTKKGALALIEKGRGDLVAEHLEKFPGLDHKEIADELFEAGKGKEVAEHLEKFPGLNHKELADKLFETGNGYYVARNLEKFTGLDHNEIAHRLFEAGRMRGFLQYIHKFQGLDKSVANVLIERMNFSTLIGNLNSFKKLDKDIAIQLIEAGFIKDVEANITRFAGVTKKFLSTFQGTPAGMTA